MLSNAYFLAKFRFDTAENEPAKNLQKCSQKPDLRVGGHGVHRGLHAGQRGEHGRHGLLLARVAAAVEVVAEELEPGHVGVGRA